MTDKNPNGTTHLSDLNPLKGILRTPGVKNIEAAYSRGGGAPSHLPGAGTNTATADSVEPRQDKHQGVSSENFQNKIADQKPEADSISAAWNQMTTTTDQGK